MSPDAPAEQGPPEQAPPPADGGEDAEAAQSSGTPSEGADSDLRMLQRRLDTAERRARRAEQRLSEAEKATQSEAERRTAAAREEGIAQGRRDAGARLAAAEFRAAAAGKLGDVAELLEDLNLARFVDEEGEPDNEAINAFVDRLAAAVPPPKAPAAPKVPNGVRGGDATDGDWLRAQIAKH